MKFPDAYVSFEYLGLHWGMFAVARLPLFPEMTYDAFPKAYRKRGQPEPQHFRDEA